MTSIVPDLDTTTFEELVEQGRSQIPRYAPGWTDHNLHDPGMTLLDLLAWIVDQQVYRVGFVGDRHLEAFARLLGARTQGPTPARGVLWPQRSIDAERALAAGAEVRCATEPDLPFALETALHLSPARLTELVVEGAGAPLVVPNEGDRTTPLSLAPSGPGGRSTLVLRFDRPLVAMPPAPVSIGVAVEPPPGQPPEPGVHTWGPLRFEHRRGDEPWTEAEVISDGTAALAQSGVVVVQVPTSDATTSFEPSELRLVLDGDAVPLERRIRRIAVNALPVVQQAVEVAATLEQGTGLPDQVVAFDSTGLVDADALEIRVGDEVWERRSSLVSAGPDDRVYVRRPHELVFGNGVNGRIPATDAAIRRGPVTRTLGERARVRAGLAWDVPALGADGSAFATTISPIGGGEGATDLAGLLVAARRSATTRQVLLTNDELGAAARLLPGFAVARAEVLDGFHPDVPDRRIDGTRTLVVIPHRRREDPAATARPAYLAAVRRLLEDRRVLGDRLVIAGHAIVAVSLEVTVRGAAGRRPGGRPRSGHGSPALPVHRRGWGRRHGSMAPRPEGHVRGGDLARGRVRRRARGRVVRDRSGRRATRRGTDRPRPGRGRRGRRARPPRGGGENVSRLPDLAYHFATQAQWRAGVRDDLRVDGASIRAPGSLRARLLPGSGPRRPWRADRRRPVWSPAVGATGGPVGPAMGRARRRPARNARAGSGADRGRDQRRAALARDADRGRAPRRALPPTAGRQRGRGGRGRPAGRAVRRRVGRHLVADDSTPGLPHAGAARLLGRADRRARARPAGRRRHGTRGGDAGRHGGRRTVEEVAHRHGRASSSDHRGRSVGPRRRCRRACGRRRRRRSGGPPPRRRHRS